MWFIAAINAGIGLDSTSPLYGRANQVLKISPMNIKYLREQLSCSPEKVVEEFFKTDAYRNG
ncbi:MAG: hypothetical protein A2W86_08170 [Bacteroidetes bacterium GWD2_45_23]|nr:MAG: hypothetical protein A2W87_04525 [Bacteroidetes bacterium GWC2_46_850]OFX80989.1 MAG: hypothetical protein A2071_11440 [Bacteroidetes bacterium GWC1_47_7]OFX82531.1 MAG: hypothetical protein A2W86_08170 [Bacteroidetes bacterium GWD2_45_23]HBB01190.1 hypothetical protein [Porphyromonadaceae bacterium]HCC18679.1 hypothetical protein [Porphyromonadaceae bacterium]